MNQIIIVSATIFEIKPFIEKYKLTKTSQNLWIGEAGFFQVEVLITGIGSTFTAFHFTLACIRKKYDLAINAGICGSMNRNFELGKVLAISSDEFGDLGIETQVDFRTLFDENLMTPNDFPFSNGKLTNLTSTKDFFIHFSKIIPDKCEGVTVNKVHGNTESIEEFVQKFTADIETMEGAAFFYVARMLNIPYIQIRSVSNYVEERNKANWNIPLAINQLNEKLIHLFEQNEC